MLRLTSVGHPNNNLNLDYLLIYSILPNKSLLPIALISYIVFAAAIKLAIIVGMSRPSIKFVYSGEIRSPVRPS